jgi:hypothetical protein
MPRLKLLLVVVPTLLAGCALRQSRGIFRLSEINSQYFLLSPDAATSQGDHQTLRIPRSRTGENPKGGAAIDCSIKGPWFSFYPAPRNEDQWIAETPSAAAWEKSSGAIDMKDQWQSFERALYQLQQRQCFASRDEFLSAQQRPQAYLLLPQTPCFTATPMDLGDTSTWRLACNCALNAISLAPTVPANRALRIIRARRSRITRSPATLNPERHLSSLVWRKDRQH